MDKRTLLIIIALLLPLVALAFLSQNDGRPGAGRGAPPLRADLNKPGGVSTPAGALPSISGAPTSPINRRPPATLEEAKARLKQRLADLDKMNEEQWQADMKARRGSPPPPPPPQESRMPDQPGDPASPPSDN